MNKILIKPAIQNETIFYVNNTFKKFSFSDETYDTINGRIKFINQKKIELSKLKLEGTYRYELLENPIIMLQFEYVHLNHFECEQDIFIDNCKLVDLDGFEYSVLDEELIKNEEIINALNIDKNTINKYNKLKPKIKQIVTLFFLIPDEENEYYLKINKGSIEEI